MEPIGCAFSSDRNEQAHCVAIASGALQHMRLVPHRDASYKITAMPWRICGNVIAGVHFFPPQGFRHQKPCGNERKRLMMVPARPMTHLIVRQPGFALTPLETSSIRCSALATRANPPAGSGAQRWRGNNPPSPPAGCHGRGNASPPTSPRGLADAWVRDTTRRLTASTTRGPLEPSRTSTCLPGVIVKRCGPRSTPCQGRCARRPRRWWAGGAVSRSRISVFEGTASIVPFAQMASRRRNQYGRPISSSPAIHACGSQVPFVSSISNANWCRVR